MISVFATVERNLTPSFLMRGKNKAAMVELAKAFDKLEAWLENSKTGFFGFAIPTGLASASPHATYDADYSMVDLYGFPHVLRIYYTQCTPLEKKIYKKLFPKNPAIHRWVTLMLKQEKFQDDKTLIPRKTFTYWIEELMTLPVGTKPPLRLPVKL